MLLMPFEPAGIRICTDHAVAGEVVLSRTEIANGPQIDFPAVKRGELACAGAIPAIKPGKRQRPRLIS
jgi:hypothetical protein